MNRKFLVLFVSEAVRLRVQCKALYRGVMSDEVMIASGSEDSITGVGPAP